MFSSLLHTAVTSQPLTKAGSNRQYFRLTLPDASTLIGVQGTSREENHAFISLARHFEDKHLNAPRIIAVSDDEMTYIQEDLGQVSLYDAIATGRKNNGQYTDTEIALLERTISLLPQFQRHAAEGLDFNVCYPQPTFDKRNILFDLNYFKYCFLKLSDIDFHEGRLQDDFERFADDLLSDSGPWGFMIRDFQARNVMLVDGREPYYIDFQGGRHGPILYDVASFLWQASARYSDELRTHLINIYADALGTTADSLAKPLQRLVLFRILQTLGAYGFRGLIERKPHFLNSIPPAIANLSRMLDTAAPYNELHATLQALIEKYTNTKTFATNTLTVRIYSFSYKRGIPEDESGNGGGYVFDCRSTHNPGRYEPYKTLTGLDKPVIDFLESDGEILTFLDSVYRLADAHVERYIERGFTNLMFAFGCTGGQHRSVYSAQHLAEHLHWKYGIQILLEHREQGIKTVFERRG